MKDVEASERLAKKAAFVALSTDKSKLTKQKVFDASVIGVLHQGNYATTKTPWPIVPDRICVLKNKNGLKCAFGQLIRDSDYDPEMDNEGMSSLAGSEKFMDDIFVNFENLAYLKKFRFLLHALQDWHDTAAYDIDFKGSKEKKAKYMFARDNLSKLLEIAKTYKVSLDNVNTYIEARGFSKIK